MGPPVAKRDPARAGPRGPASQMILTIELIKGAKCRLRSVFFKCNHSQLLKGLQTCSVKTALHHITACHLILPCSKKHWSSKTYSALHSSERIAGTRLALFATPPCIPRTNTTPLSYDDNQQEKSPACPPCNPVLLSLLFVEEGRHLR